MVIGQEAGGLMLEGGAQDQLQICFLFVYLRKVTNVAG